MAVSAEYEWPGNLDQLYSICERLVLLTQKRNIDETFLREQLEQMVPRLLPGTEQVVLYQDRRAVELAALMKKHKGNPSESGRGAWRQQNDPLALPEKVRCPPGLTVNDFLTEHISAA